MSSISLCLQKPCSFFQKKLEGLPKEPSSLTEKISKIAKFCLYQLAYFFAYPFYLLGKALSYGLKILPYNAPSSPGEAEPSLNIETESPKKLIPLPILSPRSAEDQVEYLLQDHSEEYEAICQEFPQLDPSKHQDLFPVYDEGKDRYKNILPNNPTRVVFDKTPAFYYNANWVLDRTAIACQGPTVDTVGDFWEMVLHSQSNTIVMLTDPMEGENQKCEIYWPENPGAVKEFPNGIQVTMTKKSKTSIEGFDIKARTFVMTKNGERREIVQFHLCNWKDFNTIPSKALAYLIKMVCAGLSLDTLKKPIIAHCSAGLGRTGTFLALLSAFTKLLKEGKDPQMIPQIVKDLRNPETGRNGMVQNKDQYELIYKTVCDLAKEIDNKEASLQAEKWQPIFSNLFPPRSNK